MIYAQLHIIVINQWRILSLRKTVIMAFECVVDIPKRLTLKHMAI